MVIVPSVDVRGGRVAFRAGVGADVAPADLARRFVAMGARELHLVDLDGAERGEYANAEPLARIARGCGVPCRLAGGIASLAHAREALAAGFAGVLFSSAVFGDDGLLGGIAALGDAAIVELEAADGALEPRGGDPRLVARARGRAIGEAARAAVAAGVRSLYVIDVTTDGRLGGPALALLERVRASLGPDPGPGVALHTGGGIRDLTDIALLARWGAASAVVGRALADGRFTLADASEAADAATVRPA